MAKKSPIKNLVSSVTAGVHRSSTLSQLIDSASNAVHQGAQLSQHVVASSSSIANNKRRQPREDNGGALAAAAVGGAKSKSSSNYSSGSGVRVRDAIHMFDMAAASSKKKDTKGKSASPSAANHQDCSSYPAAASFRHSPYRRYHRGAAVKRDDGVEKWTHLKNDDCGHYDNDDDDGVNAIESMRHHHYSGSNTQCHEKENASNNLNRKEKDRHQLLMKKNERSAATSSSVAITISTNTTNEQAPRKKASNHPIHQPTAINHECEYQTTTSSEVKRGSCQRTDDDVMEADMRVDTRKGRGSGVEDDAIHSSNRGDKNDEVTEEAYMNLSEDQRTTTTKKRESTHTTVDEAKSTVLPVATRAKKINHPLIQSPLRKHIKIVHESACANASCTMIKEPFPLMVLPPSTHQQREDRSSDHFLHTLNTLTANTTTVTTKIGATRHNNNVIKDENSEVEGGDHDHWQGCSGSNTANEEEEAIDLLTSASFLFRQSRRKLG